MTQQQLNEIREMFSIHPITGQKIEGTLPAPAFSADNTPCTLGLNFDIDEYIANDENLYSIYQSAYDRYSREEI